VHGDAEDAVDGDRLAHAFSRCAWLLYVSPDALLQSDAKVFYDQSPATPALLRLLICRWYCTLQETPGSPKPHGMSRSFAFDVHGASQPHLDGQWWNILSG
jgi:hypothetical protein